SELQVLWRLANRREGKYAVVRAHSGGALEHNVCHKLAVFAHFDSWAHYAVRPNAAGRRDLRRRINDGRGVDQRAGCPRLRLQSNPGTGFGRRHGYSWETVLSASAEVPCARVRGTSWQVMTASAANFSPTYAF